MELQLPTDAPAGLCDSTEFAEVRPLAWNVFKCRFEVSPVIRCRVAKY